MTNAENSSGYRSAGGISTLLFYLVCDESGSMRGEKIAALNEGLKDIFQKIASDPVVNDKALISIVAFNDQAKLVVPLGHTADHATFPSCEASGTTSYKSAFTLLKTLINEDVQKLKAEVGTPRVLGRPIVFFMSDGAPNHENWQQSHADLIENSSSNPYRPHIITFGLGEANRDVLYHVATPVSRAESTRFAYMALDSTSPGAALMEIIGFICSTIIGSTRTDEVQIPPLPDGSNVSLIDPNTVMKIDQI